MRVERVMIGRQRAGLVPVIFATAAVSSAAFAGMRLYSRYRRDLARASERLAAARSVVAQTACGPIEYASEGEGIRVLELHGIFGGFDQGLLVARPVLGEGFRIIAPSRFGYLRTPLPAGASPATQADSHACLLDYLGIERAIVMAHSAGTPSAIQLALRHRDRLAALVLVSPAAPGPGPTAPPRPLVEALFRTDMLFWLVTTFIRSSLPIGVPKGITLTPNDRAEVSQIVETMLPATPRRDGFVFDMFVSTPAINSGWPFDQISVPTLVVTAVDDPLALPDNARRLAAVIPNARLLEVDRGGHLLLGQAQVVGDHVRRFIRECTAPSADAGTSEASFPER